jgi:hypothetical protein
MARNAWSSGTDCACWTTALSNGPFPVAVNPLPIMAKASDSTAVPRTPYRSAAQVRKGVRRYGMVAVHRPPRSPKTAMAATRELTARARVSPRCRSTRGERRHSSTGATTRTPSASPTTYRIQTSTNGLSKASTEVIVPIVAPIRGPTTTPQPRNSRSLLTGVSRPSALPSRRSSIAATSGSMVFPRAHPSAAATG